MPRVVIRIIVEKQNNSYYTSGYADGYANNLENVSIEYTYHKHVDCNGNASSATIYSTTNPGGCYVSSGHTHNATGTCPTHTTTTSTYCGSWKLVEITEEGWHMYQCTGCNSKRLQTTANSDGGWGYGTHYVDTSNTVYDCGSPVNTWIIGCGKSETSIESAIIKFN